MFLSMYAKIYICTSYRENYSPQPSIKLAQAKGNYARKKSKKERNKERKKTKRQKHKICTPYSVGLTTTCT